MQRKFAKKIAYNAGRKGTGNQELIYQHMSNHYRRILNAKKVVDTSPPYCYKQKRPTSSHVVPVLPTARSCRVKQSHIGRNDSPAATERSISTNSCSCTGPYPSSRYHATCVEEVPRNNSKKFPYNKGLIDRITYDTKNGPLAYSDHDWIVNGKPEQTTDCCKAQEDRCKINENLSRNSKRRLNNRDTETERKRIYSLQLESKGSPELPIECSPEATSCKCRKLCVCDPTDEDADDLKKNQNNAKEQSQTSSRDSAYNGGVSSPPESPSPSPDQRVKKDCCCAEHDDRVYQQGSEVSKPVEKPAETLKSAREAESVLSNSTGTSSRRETPREPPLNFPEVKNEKDIEALRKMKEDAKYIKFVQDITVEILEKCLYTNKALKKIMKKHILNNMDVLEKGRMLKEVDNLRVQLGIPEDNSLFDFSSFVCDSFSDVTVPYPVISDSQFLLPEEGAAPESSSPESFTGTSKTCEESTCFWRSSQVCPDRRNPKKSLSSESDNEELVSVIQAGSDDVETACLTRTSTYQIVRDENSESSESSDKCSRKSRKKVTCRASRQSSPSSSEIEEKISGDGDVSMESGNEDEKTRGVSQVPADVRKKYRTVSFWNAKEHADKRRERCNSPKSQSG